jgi:DNA topoisomerase I
VRVAAAAEVGQVRQLLCLFGLQQEGPASCTFTKENTAGKPDMNTPEAQEAGEQEEYCDNCGRVMVLRRGPFGPFMSCPGYNEDPPCKTFRKLSQKQQQKQNTPKPTGEDCPVCGKPLVLRQGVMGSLSPAPAIPSAST